MSDAQVETVTQRQVVVPVLGCFTDGTTYYNESQVSYDPDVQSWYVEIKILRRENEHPT